MAAVPSNRRNHAFAPTAVSASETGGSFAESRENNTRNGRSWIICPLGIRRVGCIKICYGVLDAACSVAFRPIEKKFGLLPLYILGAAVNISVTTAMVLLAGLRGLANVIWRTHINRTRGFGVGTTGWCLFSLVLLPATAVATIGIEECVNNIEQDLGFTKAQEMCNKQIEKTHKLNSPEDGSKFLNELVTAVETNLARLATAVTELQRQIEAAQNNATLQSNNEHSNGADVLTCCNARNKLQECVFLPSYVTEDQRSNHFSGRVTEVIGRAFASNPLLRQYYAKPSGAMITYPANRFAGCHDYDPRNRSWYRNFEAATFPPMDMVVLVDTSRSMERNEIHGRTIMELAKKSVQMVVDTLTSNDRVAVISFSDEIATALENDCYSEELAVATPHNKRVLKEFIESLHGKGLTNYVTALATAAQYFSPLTNDSARDQILLFISDGMPTIGGGEEEIVQTIKKKFSSNVRIMTVGLGKALQDQPSRQLLVTMSTLHSSSKSFFTEVNSPGQLVKSVTDYYPPEPLPEKTLPHFTLPYFDPGSNDVILSACLPVRNQSFHFNGVTCVDASFNVLFKRIIDFKKGEYSYAFLVNHQGKALLHPLLPNTPSFQDDIGLNDIGALERDSAVQKIVAEMIKGRKGQQIISRGDPHLKGVEPVWRTSTYVWTPIANTSFSVCVVLRQGQELPRFPRGADPNFIYHLNTSKFWQTAHKCLLNNRLVLKDRSSVEFPFRFLKELNVTEQYVDNMTLYVRNQSDGNVEFKDSQNIRDVVAFAANALSWKNQDLITAFVWRYVAAVNGVIRVYPGITFNSLYDVHQRSWYQRTLNAKGKLVFTGPYLDYWGSGYVVSITKAICKDGCEPYSTNRPLVAVIGGDVTMYHLYDLLIQSQDQCKPDDRCLIVDNNGYIVLHYDFINPKKGQPTIESVHISVKEPEIAQKLIHEQILQMKGCLDVMHNMKNTYFWQIFSCDNANRTFENFDFQPIPHTNLFLIKKADTRATASPVNNCLTVMHLVNTSFGIKAVCTELRSKEDGSNKQLRDCKCSGPSEFNQCKNTLGLHELSDSWPTCTPESASSVANMSRYHDPVDPNDKPCSQVHCPSSNNQSDCRRKLGCMWCLRDGNGDPVTAPHCIKNAVCYYGILGHSGPYSEKGEVLPQKLHQEREGIDNKNLAGYIVPVLLAVIVMIVVIYIKCEHRRQVTSIPRRESLDILQRNTSIVEESGNPSLMWNPMYTIFCALSQSRVDSNVDSMTSSSVKMLTRKVEALEALVKHFEHQSVPRSPLAMLDTVRYSGGTASVISQSSSTRSSSWPKSTIPSAPSTVRKYSYHPRPKLHFNYYQPTSHTPSIRELPNSGSQPISEAISWRGNHWPGSPASPSQFCKWQEPTESCPCSRMQHHHCCNIQPSEQANEQPQFLCSKQTSKHKWQERICPCGRVQHRQCFSSLPNEQACEETPLSCRMLASEQVQQEPSERICPCGHTQYRQCFSNLCSEQANEQPHFPCRKKASENTWREPSERSCPSGRIQHHQCFSSLPSEQAQLPFTQQASEPTWQEPSEWICPHDQTQHRQCFSGLLNEQTSEQLHLPCSKQAVEHTWREPSERSCPCGPIQHHNVSVVRCEQESEQPHLHYSPQLTGFCSH